MGLVQFFKGDLVGAYKYQRRFSHTSLSVNLFVKLIKQSRRDSFLTGLFYSLDVVFIVFQPTYELTAKEAVSLYGQNRLFTEEMEDRLFLFPVLATASEIVERVNKPTCISVYHPVTCYYCCQPSYVPSTSMYKVSRYNLAHLHVPIFSILKKESMDADLDKTLRSCY
ncbi:hypothetical protein FF38_10796 [Lucilia cuprina]|uniref:Uncharacterized protein n=1 Tax=Lucilia cuprina TaxID=7375 RepID=A0A0L0BMH8_LUCCU|nr:hypothetical protein FF38_10796 [Lucilia cuprina]